MTDNEIDIKSSNEITPFAQVEKIFDSIPAIFSRIESASSKPLKVIDESKLMKIKDRLEEQNEKMACFGKSDSHSSRKLMTMQMLNCGDSTFRVIKQILAQIEKKQTAISQSYFKLKKQYVTVNELKEKIEIEPDRFKKQKHEISYQEKQVNIANAFIYLEAALKEIGLLQDAYEEIKRNKGISDDWDELDVEKAEIEFHIKSAFRNCVRDFLCHGKIGMGTVEYVEQMGVSPIEAIYHVQNFIQECNLLTSKVQYESDYDKLPDYEHFHGFLNKMYLLYQNHYKKACKAIGLDKVISSDFLLLNDKHKEEQNGEEQNE